MILCPIHQVHSDKLRTTWPPNGVKLKQALKKPVSISFSFLPFWPCNHEVLTADSPVQCYIFDFPNYDIYNASGLSYRVFIKPDSYRIPLYILVYCSTQQSSAAFAIFDAISAFKGSKAIGLTSSRALHAITISLHCLGNSLFCLGVAMPSIST